MGGLPPVFMEFLGSSKGVKTALGDVKTEMAVADEAGAGAFKKTGMLGKAAIAGIGIAAAGAALMTVHMAADFQTQMTRVRTGAGEAASNMRLVGDGVLAMAGQVGQSTTELTSGLYGVESAGYHGTNALLVLKTAAMGAKVGAADLATTSDALTTAMNAYKMPADQATAAMNALIATEGQGKTNLEALAGSMASILPTSAAAHVGLNEVLGAMATMTSQGTPAAVAATYLRQTIGMLSNPSSKAAAEMKDLGLSSVQVAQNLGKRGLASTLTELTDAIQRHLGPAGTVLIQHLQAAAHNTTAYQKVLANLPPAQQTYIGALATMVGGTKSMQAALELTGPHMKDFQANTATIGEHVKAGGKQVEGWADVQKTFNQRMAQAKDGLGAMAIQIGQYLLPAVTTMAGVVASSVTWLTKHKQIAEAVAIVIGGALVFALAAMTASLYAMAAAAAVNPLTWIVLGVVALITIIVLLVMHWRSVWTEIVSIATGVGHWISSVWQWIAVETERIWKDDIVRPVLAAWNATVAFFEGAWHRAVDPIINAWNLVYSVTAQVWNAISGFFTKWWPLLLTIFGTPIAILMSIWNHCHQAIFAAARAVWGAISGFFVATWHLITSTAQGAWSLFKRFVIAPIEEVWAEAQGPIHAVERFLAGAWALIKRVALQDWLLIKQYIIGPILGAYHSVTSTFDKIKAAISSKLDAAWHAVSTIGSRFLSIGSSIVQGIINGITGSAGSLFDTIKGLANDALNAAKNFLGINSPSKRAAGEIGKPFAQGAAQGVTDHAHLAVNAVRAMASRMSGQSVALGLTGASFGAGSAGPGGGQGGGQVAHVTTIVQMDGAEVYRAVQPHALRFDRHNASSGLVYARG